MGLDNLNPEEAKQLSKLLEKADVYTDGMGDLPPQEGKRKFGEAPKPNPSTIQRVLPATDWVEKQISTLQAVGEANYLRGIRNPKKDPIKAGIDAQGKYEAAMKDPKVLKRRKEALQKTNMDEWTAMTEAIGAGKLVEGVVARKFKVERFVAKFQPLLKAHLVAIDAMPDVTDANREAKMIANVKGLKELKGKA
uniref:Uncharacterized protein n=1 Tax=viral metagenome TaxID=1070528 RepID=A0A6M3LUC8_9ZZZZ